MIALLLLPLVVPMTLAWVPVDRRMRARGMDAGRREWCLVIYALAIFTVVVWTLWVIYSPRH